MQLHLPKSNFACRYTNLTSGESRCVWTTGGLQQSGSQCCTGSNKSAQWKTKDPCLTFKPIMETGWLLYSVDIEQPSAVPNSGGGWRHPPNIWGIDTYQYLHQLAYPCSVYEQASCVLLSPLSQPAGVQRGGRSSSLAVAAAAVPNFPLYLTVQLNQCTRLNTSTMCLCASFQGPFNESW